MIDTISVIGLGKLGSPLAAVLASRGFKVIGADKASANVDALNDGLAPVREPGLQELIGKARVDLAATTDTAEAVASTQATFVIVPTPSGPDGRFSNDYVIAACHDIAEGMSWSDTYHLIVITSTVMPGSTMGPIKDALESCGAVCGRDFGLCYSPEFIALGNVINGLLRPDAVLIGSEDPLAAATLADIYRRVCENDPPIATMNAATAEIAKLALNCFLTTKIGFANFIGWLCRSVPHTNSHDVMNFLGLDSRISSKYLRPGPPFGGPCFPRDNRALSAYARNLWMPAALPDAIHQLNEYGIERIVQEVKKVAKRGDCVAILGLAYKAGTHITEDSPSMALIERLVEESFTVVAHDPMIEGRSAETAIDGAHVVVIMLPYPEFGILPFQNQIVIDCWNIVEHVPKGIQLIKIGVG